MQIVECRGDFTTSLRKSLSEIDKDWESYNGVIVAGSHEMEKSEEKIELIRKARENKVPALLICAGMQLGIVEYARNVLGLKDANSIELNPDTPHPVVIKMPKLRVGIYPVKWHEFGSKLYSHWHHWKFNEKYREQFEKDWMMSFTGDVLEIMKLKAHPFMYGLAYHPEYDSSRKNPDFILKKFLNTCKKK